MAFISYPFTSNVTYDEHENPIYDRAVSAEMLRALSMQDRSNGVVLMGNSGALQVNATSPVSRNVTVAAGHCFIQGAIGYNNAAVTLSIPQASAANPRYDTVVARMDIRQSFRNINVYVKSGTAATNPQPPALTRNAEQWEIGLADILVPKSSTTVQQQHIYDTRLNTARCGQSLPHQQVETTRYYAQLKDQVDRNLALIQSAIDGTTAGHLQAQITTINNVLNTYKRVGAIWISYENTSPAIYFGGEWEPIKNFVLRAGEDVKTGGSDTHTLTAAQLAAHNHPVYGTNGTRRAALTCYDGQLTPGNNGITSFTYSQTMQSRVFAKDGEVGSETRGQGHNNLPHYQNLYVWRRKK